MATPSGSSGLRVCELVEALLQQDQDAEVLLDGRDGYGYATGVSSMKDGSVIVTRYLGWYYYSEEEN